MHFAVPMFGPILPELLLLAGALALLLLGAIQGEKAVGVVDLASIVILLGTAVLVILEPGVRVETFDGSFVVDNFSRFMKVLALLGSASAIVKTSRSRSRSSAPSRTGLDGIVPRPRCVFGGGAQYAHDPSAWRPSVGLRRYRARRRRSGSLASTAFRIAAKTSRFGATNLCAAQGSMDVRSPARTSASQGAGVRREAAVLAAKAPLPAR